MNAEDQMLMGSRRRASRGPGMTPDMLLSAFCLDRSRDGELHVERT
jgi:hypothetical protein